MTTLRTSADPVAAKADLVVVTVPASPGRLTGPAAALDAALGGAVAAAVADGVIDGAAGSSLLLHGGDAIAATRAGVVGTGDGAPHEWEQAGRAAAGLADTAKATSLALVPAEDADALRVRALVEGVGIAGRRFTRFKTGEAATPGGLKRLAVHSAAATRADLARADRVVRAVNGARDLADTPANHLTPSDLATYARELASATPGLSATVLGRRKLEELGAGGLLGVARGSAEAPKMIVLRYRPKAVARPGEVLGLVGKAVTFDTGGISIKPSGGMEEMKLDMGGGAAVLEATGLIAALGLPVEVLTVIPATENMPGGTALKPGDVITAMNGTTIEVLNTDAEGRLILADGLAYAVREGATRLIDMATLTGAIVVALGEVYAGLFGSDDDWTALVRDAGERSGDLAWPMPLHDRYRKLLDSSVADIANISNKRQAGAVLAAMFLKEFTAEVPWCHVDIAATGMVDGAGTGFGVRLALAVADRLAEPA
ncbi:MAG: leucyl aminopeptidase [Thermoleophilia bacterium]